MSMYSRIMLVTNGEACPTKDGGIDYSAPLTDDTAQALLRKLTKSLACPPKGPGGQTFLRMPDHPTLSILGAYQSLPVVTIK